MVYRYIYQHNSSSDVQVGMIYKALSLFESNSSLLSLENKRLKRELITDLMKFKVRETVRNYDTKLQTIGFTMIYLRVHAQAHSLTISLVYRIQQVRRAQYYQC